MNHHLEPVFLLGAGRSGTKFLRDILGSSTNIATIPYDVGYIWRYGNESYPHDELPTSLLNPKIKQYIRATLPTLINKETICKDTRFFIEKSVPNTLRPYFLQAIYPDAKFIHLIRDGRAVSESAIRLWQAPPKKSYLLKKLRYFPWKNYRYAFWYITNIIKGKLGSGRGQQTWGPRYNGIDEDVRTLKLETVCARQWKKCVETSIHALNNFDNNNVLTIHYEDLMKDSSTLESICDFLDINDKSVVIEHYEKKVIRSNTEKWKSSLTSKQIKLINDEIQDINSSLGYTYS